MTLRIPIAKIGLVLSLVLLPLLASCGTTEPFDVPLHNQDGQQVTLPLDNKATVVFFFTTYT
jgi:cytochrome oxidase Cu insertion factor (SCO1/SenC/PrrC family)